MQSPDWATIAGLAVTMTGTITVPIMLYMWSNRRQARLDIEKKHEENREKFEEILTERRYFPAHGHVEKDGALTAAGIRWAPARRNHDG